MKANIKLTLTRLVPSKVNALLGHVIARMTGNDYFPDPIVPLADMMAMELKLRDAISEATDGSRLSKFERNDLVEVAKEMLRKQADYVRSIANGDAVILTSSGFDLQRERRPIGILAAPYISAVDHYTQHGQIKIRWNRVRGARAYKVWMRFGGPDAPWVLITATSQASCIVKGLESFQPYWFQVQGIGARGDGAMSNAVLGRAV